tara:strand:- start:195 stop:842 length:648 start_codon:yes stop_codon:yes gene_type:complete
MKRLIRKILREEIEKSDKHYRMLDKISDHVQLPYFKSMEGLTIDDKDDQLYILKKILGDGITIHLEGLWEYPYDDFTIIKDGKGNEIYEEFFDDGSKNPDSYDGKWYKREYDDNGNLIYREHSDGFWVKFEYDKNGNNIYFEDSDGIRVKYEYDDKGNNIYQESSDGGWEKFEYDDKGNQIYRERSYGYWEKWEYDEDGDDIYYEDSDGYIIDER